MARLGHPLTRAIPRDGRLTYVQRPRSSLRGPGALLLLRVVTTSAARRGCGCSQGSETGFSSRREPFRRTSALWPRPWGRRSTGGGGARRCRWGIAWPAQASEPCSTGRGASRLTAAAPLRARMPARCARSIVRRPSSAAGERRRGVRVPASGRLGRCVHVADATRRRGARRRITAVARTAGVASPTIPRPCSEPTMPATAAASVASLPLDDGAGDCVDLQREPHAAALGPAREHSLPRRQREDAPPAPGFPTCDVCDRLAGRCASLGALRGAHRAPGCAQLAPLGAPERYAVLACRLGPAANRL